MINSTDSRFDVLVVGGGPAGMAAAVRAAESGARVGIVDDNPALGGQIWRSSTNAIAAEAESWIERLRSNHVTLIAGTRVVDQPETGVLHAECGECPLALPYKKLVLATGARELFLPFPGWMLPNVMGAGGLQAMVKSGLPVFGKRVVIAGTGPLLLAVAAYLRKHGASVLQICEQASWRSMAGFGMSLLSQPAKIWQALRLTVDIGGVPLHANSWIVAAHGDNALQAVTIARRGGRQTLDCDYLACGFHLVPNTELPRLLGCAVESGFVRVNDLQETTAPDIFCAGEPTGIGGVELSLIEGQIAGFAAAGFPEKGRSLLGKRNALRRFARAMDRAFCLRSELQTLTSPETIVCRCEDVTFAQFSQHTSWRSAKLQTRCGMGPCQGRVCGPAAEFLFQWEVDSPRPPIFPARVETLASSTSPSSARSDSTTTLAT